MLTAITGINWGDEGKGRIVDLLSGDYDIVIRYQGGNNAGHTVINERGKFILNLLPSGILREETVNLCGPGMVVDAEHLFHEVARLKEGGIVITPKNLKISDRAVICMPYHKLLDCLEEDRLGDAKFGSTRRGIAPAYADRYMKKVIRFGDLFNEERLVKKLTGIIEWKNLTVKEGYKHEALTVEEVLSWLQSYAYPFKDHVVDSTEYLMNAVKEGKNILFEAQLGALRDIDMGICPYTSSSNSLAAYAPIGAGIPGVKLDHSLGIMKAYSSCVGEGPFVCELFGAEGEELRKAGGEYGAATGRPRRVGGFDVPASKYGIRMQGCDGIALTKMDVLSYLDRIPVCVAYEIDGERTTAFPYGEALEKATPVYEYLPGWKSDISSCRHFGELPKEAQDYIRYIEKATESKITLVSVGAEREAYFMM